VRSRGGNAAGKHTPEACQKLPDSLKESIRELNHILHDSHLHFGYRVANEMARFLRTAEDATQGQEATFALDLQVLQKVLPKLSGSRAKLEKPLTELLAFAHQHRLAESAKKIYRMLEAVKSVGFVSFVE